MTSEEGLAFLRAHQPMPRDSDIASDVAAQYVDVVTHFLENPDARAIPLLLGSIPEESTLGMYDSIGFVLMEFPLSYTLSHLQDALLARSPGLVSRCCRWAGDLGAWELEPLIRFNSKSEAQTVRDAATGFLAAFEKRPQVKPEDLEPGRT